SIAGAALMLAAFGSRVGALGTATAARMTEGAAGATGPASRSGAYASRAPVTPPVRFAAGAWPVYVTVGLSGMTALAAEALWTRHLALLFGPTVYAFALILAVFLLGLGLGSGAGSLVARRVGAARALAACQWLLAAGIAWAAFAI